MTTARSLPRSAAPAFRVVVAPHVGARPRWRMWIVVGVVVLAAFLAFIYSRIALAQNAAALDGKPDWLLPVKGLDVDPRIPTLEQVVGFDWAEEITSHAEIERYVHALAKAAPSKAKLVRYGSTYERRGLYYLVISSPAIGSPSATFRLDAWLSAGRSCPSNARSCQICRPGTSASNHVPATRSL